ncbi:MAG: glycosyltransferase [Rhodothermales bacterium]
MITDYDVVIRSLGNPEYLGPTIDALRGQSLKPREILIVVPDGAPDPPLENYESIRIERCRKGMISQRAQGIKRSSSRYQLLMDDDVVLKDPGAVEHLFQTLDETGAVCVVPLLALPTGLMRIPLAVFGIAVPWFRPKVKHTAGGGFMYPVGKRATSGLIDVDGARGACLAVDAEFLRKHEIFGDSDLENGGYAFREDAAFVFEMTRQGGSAKMIEAGAIEHIGVSHPRSPDEMARRGAAIIINSHLFWEKYARRKHEGRIWPSIAFGWTILGHFLLALAVTLRRGNLAPVRGWVQGCKQLLEVRH